MSDVYVYLSDNQPPPLSTSALGDSVNVDWSAGEVTGIEILGAVAVTVDGAGVDLDLHAEIDRRQDLLEDLTFQHAELTIERNALAIALTALIDSPDEHRAKALANAVDILGSLR